MKSLVETVEVVVVAVSLVVLEVSSTMEEVVGAGTATLLASAADRPTTGRPTTVVVVVDQGTASRDKR